MGHYWQLSPSVPLIVGPLPYIPLIFHREVLLFSSPPLSPPHAEAVLAARQAGPALRAKRGKEREGEGKAGAPQVGSISSEAGIAWRRIASHCSFHKSPVVIYIAFHL